MARKKEGYSLPLKLQTIQLVKESGQTVAELARSLAEGDLEVAVHHQHIVGRQAQGGLGLTIVAQQGVGDGEIRHPLVAVGAG